MRIANVLVHLCMIFFLHHLHISAAFTSSTSAHSKSCFDDITSEGVWASGLKALGDHHRPEPRYIVSITETSECSDIPWSEGGFQGVSFEVARNFHAEHCGTRQRRSDHEDKGITRVCWSGSHIISQLNQYNIPTEIDVLRLDAMKYTCGIAEQILSEGYVPNMILAKFNAIFSPPVNYELHINASAWTTVDLARSSVDDILQSGLAGCSFSRLSDILRSHGFTPIERCQDAAIYLRSAEVPSSLDISTSDLDVWVRGCAYDTQRIQEPLSRETISSLIEDVQSKVKADNLSSLINIYVDHMPPKSKKANNFVNPGSKIDVFEETVCLKCLQRNIECGCHLGEKNPAFLVLRHLVASTDMARSNMHVAPTKWIVVHMAGGVGNQQLQMVTGMMLAIATGRAIALDSRVTGTKGQDHTYPYDAAFDFPLAEELENITLPGGQQMRSRDIVYNLQNIELLTCGNLVDELSSWDVVDIMYGQSPHFFLGNPYHGQFLIDSFWGKPFFFLSHFAWIGREIRQVPVHFSTLPAPQLWDGIRTLDDFSHQLLLSNVASVIGMHVRIYSKRAFEYFDHRFFNRSGSLEHASYCRGHPGSLEDLNVCIGHLIDLERSKIAREAKLKGSIVILWATDNDDLAAGLLQHLLSFDDVLVVKLVHESSERFDVEPITGMLDMAMLEGSDILIGTTTSTFSYAVHARGLIRPLYPSFRRDRSSVCGKAAETEAGLLTYGTAHDQCQYYPEKKEVVCATMEHNCLHFVMGSTFMGKCIQHVGKCLGGNTDWAKPYLLDFDLPAIQTNYLAKNFIHFKSHITLSQFKTCVCNEGSSCTQGEDLQVWKQYDRFQRVVCDKCAARGIECGCELYSENPAFIVLSEFVETMEAARKLQYKSPLKWIVVPLMGGLGNHQLQLVSGMLFALVTGRGLAVDWSYNLDDLKGHSGHDYDYDPVLQFPTYKTLNESSPLNTLNSVLIGESHVLDLACKDLELHFRDIDFLRVSFAQAPHVLLSNPLYTRFLKETFWGKPFFFLSHFVWIGHEIRQVPVHFSTLPVPQAWDGMHTLDDFSHQLQLSNAAIVIGMHLRIHTRSPFVYLDHRHFKGSDTLEHASYCSGNPGSLEDFQECIDHLIESEASATHNGNGVEGSVVVLWSTDNDELTSDLLQYVQSCSGVNVVRILHLGHDRTDRLPWTGMLDLSFLEQADVLIGTTGSTMSFTAHARGLIQAHYPSFRLSRLSGCGTPVGTEGGLLYLGPMYDECTIISFSKIKCAKYRPDCLHVLSGTFYFKGCLQSFNECFSKDTTWASPYLIDVDLEAVSLYFLARRSVQFEYGDQAFVLNTCPAVSHAA